MGNYSGPAKYRAPQNGLFEMFLVLFIIQIKDGALPIAFVEPCTAWHSTALYRV